MPLSTVLSLQSIPSNVYFFRVDVSSSPYKVDEPYFSAIDRSVLPDRIRPEDTEGKAKILELIRKYQGMKDYTEIDWDELRAVYLGMCMNLEAVDEIIEQFLDIEIIFIESGGDNLSSTFSPELADATIFVIDVAEGDKIPRKGGPSITRSDLLLVIKKIV